MVCSTSLAWHLLRGITGFSLLGLALFIAATHMVWAGLALVGGFVLLRGCPMCWMMGLVQRLQRGGDPTERHAIR